MKELASTTEFSFQTRKKALELFKSETFDLLVIGGGITGAATARDAVSRGLKVALIERNDFAWGTSSRSSKLIHGGLRYLENLEFPLVFEALSERNFLLKSAPHLVRPLPFYFPVYKGDAHSRFILSLGLFLYDFLALFRSPGYHKSLSRAAMLKDIPFLKSEGLKGGFRYFDASMWDDALAVETLRSAVGSGASVASYTEALTPLWDGDRMRGFKVRDRESGEEIELRAHKTAICVGPWVDELGVKLSPTWKPWLAPSKGVHLIFDLKRLPIPGALVMNGPNDGRISFVIPRPDFGAGVTIVGTTDGPAPKDPSQVEVGQEDVDYLLTLLGIYFPDLALNEADILSAYVGVRPLVHPHASNADASLQKVSREHSIEQGPGGSVLVAGGKYTTHRLMGRQIVDFALSAWKKDEIAGLGPSFPEGLRGPDTESPVNPAVTSQALLQIKGHDLPEELVSRYGAEAQEIFKIQATFSDSVSDSVLKDLGKDPAGFPCLAGQLIFAMRTGGVVHLEDFYLRRVPLFASRADHGLPWAKGLAQVWANELGKGPEYIETELVSLKNELAKRCSWKSSLRGSSRTAEVLRAKS